MSKYVLALRGTTGVGKTGLLRAMQARHKHLVDVPILRKAMARGFKFVEVGEMTKPHSRGEAVWPVVAAALEEVDYALVEPCVTYPELVEQVPDDVTLINLYLVAAPWMVAARRRTRYIMDGRATAANVNNHWAVTRWAFQNVDQAELVARARDGGKSVFLSTMDYPIQQVSLNDAIAIVNMPFRSPDFSVERPQYQQCLHVGGVWFGQKDLKRRAFEQARLNAVLPARMDGMTVLDIGAMEGAFCFESLNRGATYCMAVDILESAMRMLRLVRDAYWQPVTTAALDVDAYDLPTLNDLYDGTRYSLGLLLNVLHRVKNPQKVLLKVLEACDAVVVEGPTWVGDAPVKPEEALYPGTWHLPSAWVQKVARSREFEVESISVDPYCSEQRLIWKLRRVA